MKRPWRCPWSALKTLRRVAAFAVVVVCGIALPAAEARSFVANDFGAKGDGVTIDTQAIQSAIEAASHAGGGIVVLRPGVYLSGSLFLRSHVSLRVDEGAEIRGIHDLAAYPMMPTRVAGIEMVWPAALINIVGQTDVQIGGKGVIDGDGKFWWDSYRALRASYEPRGLRWAADYDARRPRLIQIYNSNRIRLSGLRLRRSGFWTVHICYSIHVVVDDITIRNNIDGKGPSTDGIDIDSSRNILVQHADIQANDDAICLKAGRDWDGLRVNRPTENVRVRDSIIRAGAAGFTIGSETSGGFHHIEVSGLTVLSGVPYGIYFKSAHTRGGTARDIRIHDITMDGVGTAIGITMNWNPSYSYAVIPPGIEDVPSYWKTLTTRVEPPERGIPHFTDVRIWNIKATHAKKAFDVSAYPEAPLTYFSFRNVLIDALTAGSVTDSKGWKLSHVVLQTSDGSTLSLQ